MFPTAPGTGLSLMLLAEAPCAGRLWQVSWVLRMVRLMVLYLLDSLRALQPISQFISGMLGTFNIIPYIPKVTQRKVKGSSCELNL